MKIHLKKISIFTTLLLGIVLVNPGLMTEKRNRSEGEIHNAGRKVQTEHAQHGHAITPHVFNGAVGKVLLNHEHPKAAMEKIDVAKAERDRAQAQNQARIRAENEARAQAQARAQAEEKARKLDEINQQMYRLQQQSNQLSKKN